ncbi:hypothetical protein DOY81_003734 [Sarcophaga bullata]|nr:hypothetical protein DOY81_003734 [Sarcophaga bullata]
MKTFRLDVAQVIAIICCFLIGSGGVLATPQKHKASDGREYLIETEYKWNWFEAFHECARRNSQLVIIDSAQKNTAIINLLKKIIGHSRNLWLGGNDEFSSSRDHGRPFYWSATGKRFTFTFWSNDNPDNYRNQEHCVHIWESKPLYQWNDVGCGSKMGFICEDNYYVDTCNRKLKTECDAVNKFNSDVFLKFERLQKANMDQLNSRLQTIENVAKDGKTETQKFQNANQSAVQKLVDKQELSAKNWWEKLQKQVNELSGQMKRSTEQINANFAEKLNVK